MDGAEYINLNDDKREFQIIQTRQQRSTIHMPHININGSDIAHTGTARNLSVMFDRQTNMKGHVNSIDRPAYLQLKNVRDVKHFLDTEAANTVVHAFVSSFLLRCRKLHFIRHYLKTHSMCHAFNDILFLIQPHTCASMTTPLVMT